MVMTSSTNRELGITAPPFRLADADGKIVSRDDFAANKGLLIVFGSTHYPFVKHIKRAFAEFAREYQPRGLSRPRLAPRADRTLRHD